MYDRMSEPESEADWVGRSLDLTLRTIACLAGSATGADRSALVPIIRDLADQAVIWSDLLDPGRSAGDALSRPGDVSIETAMLVARSSAGLAARLQANRARLGPETRRASVCCTADLDVHARWATETIRTAELSGLGERIRQTWSHLPSRQEFFGFHRVRRERSPAA